MKLRDIRQARLMSVMELAKRAGVSPNTVKAIESGETLPRRMDVVRKLSTVLDVPAQSIEEFQHLAGTMDRIHAALVEAHGEQLQAAIEEADREGWIEEADLTRSRRTGTDKESLAA